MKASVGFASGGGCPVWCWLTLTVCVLHLDAPVTFAHPQCLDASPPSSSSAPLTLCSEYTEFGCCSPRQEKTILDKYEHVRHRATDRDWQRCSSYVRDLLCQVCSPLSAHLYEADGGGTVRPLPGLCPYYSRRFYGLCGSLLWFLDPDLAPLVQSEEDFGQKTEIADMAYCYPDVLNRTESEGEAEEHVDQEAAGSSPDGCLCLEPVATGFANPIFARSAGDGSGRLFVGEQRGQVYVVYPETKQRLWVPFLNITDKILLNYQFGDERGMGGMAFHPDFARNGRIFVYYNLALSQADRLRLRGKLGLRRWDHKSRLSEMRLLPGRRDLVDPEWEQVLLEVDQPYANHNGGELFFLDDGYLYLFLGDGGYAGDPHNLAQNKSWLLGKVLRLDVDDSTTGAYNRQPAYSIPPDNPFVNEGNGTRPEIFACGVRNIWRCGVDMGDPHTQAGRGRVLCGDVGQSLYEEVDLLKKGANYGWNAREGNSCYKRDTCGHIGPEELPVYVYNHTVGQSVTGGQFYRGCRSPSLNGQYLYGDFQSTRRRLFSLVETTKGKWQNSDITMCGKDVCTDGLTNVIDKYILSFGQDEQGEVYMLTSHSSLADGTDGKIYLIVDPFSGKTAGDCRTRH